MIIGYHEMFEDVATFHIWGTVAMNQAFNYKKIMNESNVHSLTPDYMTFNKGIVTDQENEKTTGVSAMSLSDMTEIPRATVIRKCKYLVDQGYLKPNEKKQKVIDDSFENLAKYVNAYQQKMIMKREAIANKGIWVAKKRDYRY